jgi:HEAT repeat protein
VWRFAALCVALVAGVGAAIWYYRDAPVQGPAAPVLTRNDDRWLDDLQSPLPKDAERAASELEQRGTAALPIIRKTLDDGSADPKRRKAALKACGILGARATEAEPEVAGLLVDPNFAAEAGLALSYMGSPAVAPLRDAVSNEEPAVRKEALRGLGKLRERASIDPQIVLPPLLHGMTDPDPSVRTVAAMYLGIIRDTPATEIPPLTKALSDDDAGVRQAAADALSSYGALAEPAVPALRKAAQDPDEGVQREAGRALVTIAEAKQKGG